MTPGVFGAVVDLHACRPYAGATAARR